MELLLNYKVMWVKQMGMKSLENNKNINRKNIFADIIYTVPFDYKA